ncbi:MULTISPECIES: hypothetical protein [unclassified Streptomyces]|uniref:hypothetical protein n=1 Tax=unclassified Streptomyces TaxID=2593676 RepID=UPI001F032F05|nr:MULTISPECIES: hypothetical protein [unclassified Streptomyces]MCH0562013.1 hypothetical protein [Streptomyces sp. MUM 2J]MCH0568018.1 hypothetical protein [Streptomyces sp. MUM 136J]
MGIESDKVVYEYLSRVGDVAQQRQLPSATRMRLVSQLRDEIDRHRAKAAVDSPAAVRRILDRLGSPDDVVTAASDGGAGRGVPVQPPPAAVPVQRDDGRRAAGAKEPKEAGPRGLWRGVPRPRPAEPQAPAPRSGAPSPPHLAGAHELGGTSAVQPDWWRVEGGPADEVPGFVGGVEIPELLRPPPSGNSPGKSPERPSGEPRVDPAADGAVSQAEPAAAGRRRLAVLTARRWSNPLLLLAAGSLVVGAVLGNLVALLAGWLIAWASRRLSDAETKWAVVILPGLALTSGVVWLWGRAEGRWGEPVADGQMSGAIAETWPWVVRGAAVLSAVFLVWRSQRRPPA